MDYCKSKLRKYNHVTNCNEHLLVACLFQCVAFKSAMSVHVGQWNKINHAVSTSYRFKTNYVKCLMTGIYVCIYRIEKEFKCFYLFIEIYIIIVKIYKNQTRNSFKNQRDIFMFED